MLTLMRQSEEQTNQNWLTYRSKVKLGKKYVCPGKHPESTFCRLDNVAPFSNRFIVVAAFVVVLK